MLLFLLIISSITITNSFSMKKIISPPYPYVFKFMIFNTNKKNVIKHDNISCKSFLTSNKTCNCNNRIVKKEEDIFDRFEKASRQGNIIMQEEYLKEIQKQNKKQNKKQSKKQSKKDN